MLLLDRRSIRELVLLAITAASCTPLCGQASRGGYPLTAALVAAVLKSTGIAVDSRQIELPSGLSATASEPQLHITTADLLPDGRLRVRLACQQAAACIPFLASVRLASASEALAAVAQLQRSPAIPSNPAQSSSRRVLAGQHTTLLMQDNHMLISLEVVSIDSGTAGTEVRVSSLDRKKIFRATVVDSSTVRANLP